jgi:hypothetical protein
MGRNASEDPEVPSATQSREVEGHWSLRAIGDREGSTAMNGERVAATDTRKTPYPLVGGESYDPAFEVSERAAMIALAWGSP